MTAELIADPGACARLSAAAVRRSMDFSKDAFAERLLAIVDAWWADVTRVHLRSTTCCLR